MDEPAYLTPERLADDVTAVLPEMREVAAAQWSMLQLRSHSGTYFLSGLDEVLTAFEAGVTNAYRHLCEAVALRIAILHREGVRWVDFCGRSYDSPQLIIEAKAVAASLAWPESAS